jgi:hypothetical protein
MSAQISNGLRMKSRKLLTPLSNSDCNPREFADRFQNSLIIHGIFSSAWQYLSDVACSRISVEFEEFMAIK